MSFQTGLDIDQENDIFNGKADMFMESDPDAYCHNIPISVNHVIPYPRCNHGFKEEILYRHGIIRRLRFYPCSHSRRGS